MPIPKNAIWKLESLRLSVFLAEPDGKLGDEWWKDVTGAEPEQTIVKRQSAERIDDGAFRDDKLWLNVTSGPVGKVDWIFYPQVGATSEFPSIGDYPTAYGAFSDALRPWLANKCAPALRIAFGAILLSEVPSPAEGYKFLQSCLPFITFDLDNWSDFSFQVNKRVDSGVMRDGAIPSRLNCVTKWNSIKFVQGMLIDANNSSPSAFSEAYAVRMELDLSSPTDNRLVIKPDQLDALLSEFDGIAQRYCAEGFI